MLRFAENLRFLRKQRKMSQTELAEQLGIARTTMGDYERSKTEPSLESLVALSQIFDRSIDELLKADLTLENYEVLTTDALRVLAITVDAENRNNIELVETKAEAGYLDSFNNPEYIKELPKISVPSIPEGTYRGFEIRGDSMLPIEPGSIIIAQYVERLEEIKDGRTYVIVSKDSGLVYKRAFQNNEKPESLVLKSDNEAFLPYDIAHAEIAEVWQYFAHISFSDLKVTMQNSLEEKIEDMHRKMTELHIQLAKN